MDRTVTVGVLGHDSELVVGGLNSLAPRLLRHGVTPLLLRYSTAIPKRWVVE
jgi:hypothetical protein